MSYEGQVGRDRNQLHRAPEHDFERVSPSPGKSTLTSKLPSVGKERKSSSDGRLYGGADADNAEIDVSSVEDPFAMHLSEDSDSESAAGSSAFQLEGEEEGPKAVAAGLPNPAKIVQFFKRVGDALGRIRKALRALSRAKKLAGRAKKKAVERAKDKIRDERKKWVALINEVKDVANKVGGAPVIGGKIKEALMGAAKIMGRLSLLLLTVLQYENVGSALLEIADVMGLINGAWKVVKDVVPGI